MNCHAFTVQPRCWVVERIFAGSARTTGAQGFRHADEYQQPAQLESVAVGFLVAMTVARIFLLLEAAQIHRSAARQWVFWGGGAACGGALTVKSLQTR